MTERPRPNMSKVRDALREHDEREESEADLEATPEPEETPEDDGDT
jgi:hypothetical protein